MGGGIGNMGVGTVEHDESESRRTRNMGDGGVARAGCTGKIWAKSAN